MKTMTRAACFLMIGFLSSAFFLKISMSLAAEVMQKSSEVLIKLEGEILEVEELKDPAGSAVYTVKDLSSGETLRLFVHPYRTLIQLGGSPTTAGNILGGSKAMIIYRHTPERDIPEIVFAKITGSFYS